MSAVSSLSRCELKESRFRKGIKQNSVQLEVPIWNFKLVMTNSLLEVIFKSVRLVTGYLRVPHQGELFYFRVPFCFAVALGIRKQIHNLRSIYGEFATIKRLAGWCSDFLRSHFATSCYCTGLMVSQNVIPGLIRQQAVAQLAKQLSTQLSLSSWGRE